MDSARQNILAVHDSKFGKGTFATQNISKGAFILCIRGKQSTFNTSLELDDQESYFLQTGIDKYIILDEPFRYSNHSCDPNAGINGNLELFAIKPIAKGEEIVWDYSTSMLERYWTMRCECRSRLCRRLITDFDLLPLRIQKLYLNQGIVLPFISDYLTQQNAVPALVDMK